MDAQPYTLDELVEYAEQLERRIEQLEEQSELNTKNIVDAIERASSNEDRIEKLEAQTAKKPEDLLNLESISDMELMLAKVIEIPAQNKSKTDWRAYHIASNIRQWGTMRNGNLRLNIQDHNVVTKMRTTTATDYSPKMVHRAMRRACELWGDKAEWTLGNNNSREIRIDDYEDLIWSRKDI